MTTPIALRGTLDDIVFEGRNQAYGAYVLRRDYGQHVRKAIVLTAVIALLGLLLPLVLHYFNPPLTVVPPLPALPPIETKPQQYNITPPKPPVTPPAAAAAAAVRPHSEIATRVVRDNTPLTPPTQAALPQDNGPSGPAATPGPADPTGGTGKTSTGPATSENPGPETPAPAGPDYVLAPEVMPAFPDGVAGLKRYLEKNLRYPRQAQNNGIEGRVYVSFTVRADGSIADVEILKGLGYGTGEEAARVVGNMPPWTPGLQNKHAVPVRFTLPITFQIQ